MTKYDSARYIQAAELKSKGLTYAEIGIALNVSRQRAQQLCKPPAQIYSLLKRRSNNRCERCTIEINRGHAHHVRYGGERWNLDDLLYLCSSCHAIVEHPKIRPVDERPKNLAAQELGRMGGRVVSEAKKAATRLNLAKARAAISARKLQVTENIDTKVLD